MEPKLIHYCWFGGNPKSELATHCIESWKKYFPDYELVEWNEHNFDLNACSYVQEAYQAKKWAFVSDYVRFWALYHYGGIYFDTDVEALSSFDDILAEGAYIGREFHAEGDYPLNPGIGFAAKKDEPLLAEILEHYKTLHFLNSDGSLNLRTIVDYTTEIMERYGFDRTVNQFQKIGNISIYPSDYFSPQNMFTGEVHKTEHSHSIHYYCGSWDTQTVQAGLKIKREAVAKYGKTVGTFLYQLRYSLYILKNDGLKAFVKKLKG